MTKLVEKIVLSKISEVVEEQFAFRLGHNTTLLALRMTGDILAAFTRRMVT